MLRTNLSTRPFYNERIVHLLIALAGVIVLAITILNVVRLLDLSRHNTELTTRMGRDHAEAERLTSEAARIRGSIDQKELAAVAAAAREANTLIDQRTFSWTAFFNHLEATLPPDVMIAAVRPRVSKTGTHLTMTVLGRTVEDIDEFIEKLEATGDFDSILASQSDTSEDGLNRAVLEAVYNPGQADVPPGKTAGAPAATPEAGARPAPAPAGGARGASAPAAGAGS